MNMCFDLMEIQKRKFESELAKLENLDKSLLIRMYQKHVKEFEENKKLLISETDRGANLDKMEKWNTYIYKFLGVDNLKYFNIQPAESE